jgi:hypothetical protein
MLRLGRSRRLPDAVVAALHDTGINRLLIPLALGGMEASPARTADRGLQC